MNCDEAGLQTNSIIGVYNDINGIKHDSLAIIKSWTVEHANVCMLECNCGGKISLEPEKEQLWQDLFFCVPWDCDKDDYTFNFLDTLHPTTLYAMTSQDIYACNLHPICDTVEQLKNNMNSKNSTQACII